METITEYHIKDLEQVYAGVIEKARLYACKFYEEYQDKTDKISYSAINYYANGVWAVITVTLPLGTTKVDERRFKTAFKKEFRREITNCINDYGDQT